MSGPGEIHHCWERCGWKQNEGQCVRPDALQLPVPFWDLRLYTGGFSQNTAFCSAWVLSGKKYESPQHWLEKAPAIMGLPTGRAWYHRRKDMEERAFLKSSKRVSRNCGIEVHPVPFACHWVSWCAPVWAQLQKEDQEMHRRQSALLRMTRCTMQSTHPNC